VFPISQPTMIAVNCRQIVHQMVADMLLSADKRSRSAELPQKWKNQPQIYQSEKLVEWYVS